MATLTIRRLDDEVKRRLRIRAAANGRSMEEEARTVLTDALAGQSKPARREKSLGDAIRERLQPVAGGFDDIVPPREPMRDPPDFSGPEYDWADRK
jgi:plasmid stability protein